jgi:hypothetical protein
VLVSDKTVKVRPGLAYSGIQKRLAKKITQAFCPECDKEKKFVILTPGCLVACSKGYELFGAYITLLH